MATLIVFELPEFTSSPFDDYSVVCVIDADVHPGADMVATENYGYVYIIDREPPEVRDYLTEAEWAATDNSGNGGDVGDFDMVNTRKRMVNGGGIGGPSHKWKVYREYPHNQNIEVTWAQALAFIEDKFP